MATEAAARSLTPPQPQSWVGAPAPSARGLTWRWVVLGLVLADAAALLAAFALAYLTRFKAGFPLLATPQHSVAFYSSVAFGAIPVWIGLFAAYRLYDRRRLFEGLHEYVRVVNASTAGVLALVVLSFLDRSLAISRGWLVLTWTLSILLVVCARFLARRVLAAAHRRGSLVAPTVIVGANEEGLALAEQLRSNPGRGLDVLGFVSASPLADSLATTEPVLGSVDELQDVVRKTGAREIVIASTALSREQLLEVYRQFGNVDGVELRLSSGLFEILTTGVHVQEINGVPLMTPHRVRITGLDAVLKSALDYAIAVPATLVLAPVLLVLALLVRLDSPGPVIHRRRVLGVGGKSFDAFKLRTMIVNAERRREQRPIPFPDRRQRMKAERDPRVTRMGRFLRRTSLDELPQLLNVLRGEMSLIGPRMIVPDEAARYGKWQHNLLTVKPGLSGPWQVRGRSDIPYEERVRLSMQYIRNYSIWLDLEILLRTIVVVVRGKGAY